jgi:predicted kinase
MGARLVLLVGLPASGKSTWLEQRGLRGLSSDAVRLLLCDAEENQKINRLVFRTLRYLAGQRLQTGAPVTYIDSTALTLWERRCWTRFAQLNGCEIEAVFFDTPFEVCLARNAARPRRVPEAALRLMAARLVPPTTAEGFTRVTIVLPPAAGS